MLFTLALCVAAAAAMNWSAGTRTTWTPTWCMNSKGNLLAIETAGDSIATGSTYTIDEEAKRLHSRPRRRAASRYPRCVVFL
ncbi:MAG: hypothetical protein ACLUVV_00345 [Christensenellales bacterium]